MLTPLTPRAGFEPEAEGCAALSAEAHAAQRVLVAQLGARRHYAVPRALWRAGLLDRLVTDFSADVGPWPALRSLVSEAASPAGLRRLMQRSAGGIPPSRIVGLPGFAFDPRLRRRRAEAATDFWARRNAAFCQAVARAGLGAADAVYAFNGAALEIFEAAKARGLRTILDQTAAPWRWNAALLKEEVERWPGWEDEAAEIDASGRLSVREEAEWQLADVIVVGSDFARSALAETGGPAERAITVAYPVAARPRADGRSQPRFHVGRKLRVLFLGTLQLRKGIQYLDEAARALGPAPVELRLVGPSHLSAQALRQLSERFDVRGAVPRREVAGHLAWADLMALPTLSEGSANACREAVAAGVPILTTENAGSGLRHGLSGLVVPARSAEAIAAAVLQLVRRPEMLPAMAAAAGAEAAADSLDRYAADLAAVVSGASCDGGRAAA